MHPLRNRGGKSLALTATLAVALCGGCRQTCELVESELRFTLIRNEELEDLLHQRDAEVHALRGTLDTVQAVRTAEVDAIDGPPGVPLAPEKVYHDTGLAEVKVSGLLSGVRDRDGDGLSESVQILVKTLDADGDVFKCPGDAEVELLVVADSGRQKSLGNWRFDQQTVRDSWRSTVLGNGYRLNIPLHLTGSQKVLAIATFRSIAGRPFTASTTFTVDQPQDAQPTREPLPPVRQPPETPPPIKRSPPPPIVIPPVPDLGIGAEWPPVDGSIRRVGASGNDLSGNDVGTVPLLAPLLPVDPEPMAPAALRLRPLVRD